MTYDKAYFIAKFEAIPDAAWTTHEFLSVDKSKRCALGHCGDDEWWLDPWINFPGEVKALLRLFFPTFNPFRADEAMIGIEQINNGEHPRYPQPTPKARILAALRDLR